MGKRLNQLNVLSLQEWRLLLTAAVLLPLVAVGLRLFGFQRAKAVMARFVPSGANGKAPEGRDMNQARIAARMVGIAARHGVYRGNCLRQSLVLWWLLARRGILSEIRIGVQKEPAGPLNAHAWVECDGVPLSDSKEIQQQFSAFEPNW